MSKNNKKMLFGQEKMHGLEGYGDPQQLIYFSETWRTFKNIVTKSNRWVFRILEIEEFNQTAVVLAHPKLYLELDGFETPKKSRLVVEAFNLQYSKRNEALSKSVLDYVKRQIFASFAYFRKSSAVQTVTPSASLLSSISIMSTVILHAISSTPSNWATS